MNSISNKDGSSILFAFGKRTGSAVPQLRELTLSSYGWNHTCVAVRGPVEGLYPVDFELVAKERKLAYPSPLITGFAQNLVKAKPGRVAARPEGGYALLLNPKDVSLERIRSGLVAFRDQFVIRPDGQALAQGKLRGFCPTNDSSRYLNVGCVYPVFNWDANNTDVTRAETATYLKYVEDSLKASNQKFAFTAELRQRYSEPFTWFRRFVGEQFGLDISSMRYHGFVGGQAETAFRTAVATLTPNGCSAIAGPPDVTGRRPVWFCPMIHPRVAVLSIGANTNDSNNGGMFYTGSAQVSWFYTRGTNGTPNLDIVPSGSWRCVSSKQVFLDIAQLDLMIAGDVSKNLGAVKPIAAGDIDALKVTLGDIGDSLVSATVAGEVTAAALSTGPWRLTTAAQIRAGRFNFSHAELVNNDPGRVKINCEGIECEVPYALVRDFIANQLGDPTLTPVQKANIQRNLDKSAHLADAAVFVSVLRTPINPYGLSDVERLQIVEKGKKGDVDMMTEEFGEDKVTLKKLGNKLQADKDRGRTYQVIAHTVDDNIELGDLYSEFVVAELPRSENWAFKPRLETIDGVATLVGVDGSYLGQTYARVDMEDAAVLIGAGATSTMSAQDWVNLGVTSDDLDAAQNHGALGKRLTFNDKRPSRDGQSVVGWESLSPVEFSTWDGYPQLQYGDYDSAVRAQLVHRAMNGDTADICSMLLFTGPLDFVSGA